MEQLELLWHLQEKDLAIREIEKNIVDNPQAAAVEQAREKLAGLSASFENSGEKLKDQRRRQKSLELDLQKISTERGTLRKKLYGGEIGNVKELETMEKKLQIVEREQGSLEEKIIGLMESAEEAEALLREEERQVQAQERAVAEQERLLNEALAGLRAELNRLQAEREEIAGRLNNQYLERFSLHSKRHQGRGIARVINDNCEGCRVYISAAQRSSLYNPGAMVYCESCGRLLVRMKIPDKPGDPAGTSKEDKGEKKKRSPKNQSEGQAAG